MSKLKISDALSLPVDAVTQTIAIVAKRRAGKSYLARRMTEQLFSAGMQVVIVDPKGDWWGVRSAADGKAPGLPIVILGGERGDVRLEPGGGEVVAKLVVEERVSALLDLSLLRKHEVATFMTAFLETLYRLKAREQYRTPVMLMVDEADAIAPQKPQPNEARMLGAAEDIVRRGGQRGIGCTLITQRTAVLNKNVLTQAQVLIALRTIAPQDLKAMNAWIDVHGEDAQRATLMGSLPSLPVGDAWVWSPGWPTTEGIFKRIRTLPIDTFDSGATPKPGERRTEPRSVADVDLDAVRKQMADTIERAKADDPRELRKRIADLEKQVRAKAPTAAPAPAAKVEWVEVPVLTKDERGALVTVAKRLEQTEAKIDALVAATTETRSLFFKLQRHLDAPPAPPPRRPAVSPAAPGYASGSWRLTPRKPPASAPNGHGHAAPDELGRVHKAFLTVLAQRSGKPLTRNQLAVFSGYSATSRHVDNTISSLRTGGYLHGDRDALVITDEGLGALGSYTPLPTGQALIDYWIAEVGTAEGAMLRVLVEQYPSTLTRDQVAEASGYSVTSRHVDNCISRLRTLELIAGGRDGLQASADLMS